MQIISELSRKPINLTLSRSRTVLAVLAILACLPIESRQKSDIPESTLSKSQPQFARGRVLEAGLITKDTSGANLYHETAPAQMVSFSPHSMGRSPTSDQSQSNSLSKSQLRLGSLRTPNSNSVFNQLPAQAPSSARPASFQTGQLARRPPNYFAPSPAPAQSTQPLQMGQLAQAPQGGSFPYSVASQIAQRLGSVSQSLPASPVPASSVPGQLSQFLISRLGQAPKSVAGPQPAVPSPVPPKMGQSSQVASAAPPAQAAQKLPASAPQASPPKLTAEAIFGKKNGKQERKQKPNESVVKHKVPESFIEPGSNSYNISIPLDFLSDLQTQGRSGSTGQSKALTPNSLSPSSRVSPPKQRPSGPRFNPDSQTQSFQARPGRSGRGMAPAPRVISRQNAAYGMQNAPPSPSPRATTGRPGFNAAPSPSGQNSPGSMYNFEQSSQSMGGTPDSSFGSGAQSSYPRRPASGQSPSQERHYWTNQNIPGAAVVNGQMRPLSGQPSAVNAGQENIRQQAQNLQYMQSLPNAPSSVNVPYVQNVQNVQNAQNAQNLNIANTQNSQSNQQTAYQTINSNQPNYDSDKNTDGSVPIQNVNNQIGRQNAPQTGEAIEFVHNGRGGLKGAQNSVLETTLEMGIRGHGGRFGTAQNGPSSFQAAGNSASYDDSAAFEPGPTGNAYGTVRAGGSQANHYKAGSRQSQASENMQSIVEDPNYFVTLEQNGRNQPGQARGAARFEEEEAINQSFRARRHRKMQRQKYRTAQQKPKAATGLQMKKEVAKEAKGGTGGPTGKQILGDPETKGFAEKAEKTVQNKLKHAEVKKQTRSSQGHPKPAEIEAKSQVPLKPQNSQKQPKQAKTKQAQKTGIANTHSTSPVRKSETVHKPKPERPQQTRSPRQPRRDHSAQGKATNTVRSTQEYLNLAKKSPAPADEPAEKRLPAKRDDQQSALYLEQIASLEHTNRISQTELQKRDKEIRDLRAILGGFQSELQQQKSRNRDFEQQKDSILEQVNKNTQSIHRIGKPLEARPQAGEIESETERLKRQIQQLQKKASQIDRLEQKLTRLEAQKREPKRAVQRQPVKPDLGPTGAAVGGERFGAASTKKPVLRVPGSQNVMKRPRPEAYQSLVSEKSPVGSNVPMRVNVKAPQRTLPGYGASGSAGAGQVETHPTKPKIPKMSPATTVPENQKLSDSGATVTGESFAVERPKARSFNQRLPLTFEKRLKIKSAQLKIEGVPDKVEKTPPRSVRQPVQGVATPKQVSRKAPAQIRKSAKQANLANVTGQPEKMIANPVQNSIIQNGRNSKPQLQRAMNTSKPTKHHSPAPAAPKAGPVRPHSQPSKPVKPALGNQRPPVPVPRAPKPAPSVPMAPKSLQSKRQAPSPQRSVPSVPKISRAQPKQSGSKPEQSFYEKSKDIIKNNRFNLPTLQVLQNPDPVQKKPDEAEAGHTQGPSKPAEAQPVDKDGKDVSFNPDQPTLPEPEQMAFDKPLPKMEVLEAIEKDLAEAKKKKKKTPVVTEEQRRAGEMVMDLIGQQMDMFSAKMESDSQLNRSAPPQSPQPAPPQPRAELAEDSLEYHLTPDPTLSHMPEDLRKAHARSDHLGKPTMKSSFRPNELNDKAAIMARFARLNGSARAAKGGHDG